MVFFSSKIREKGVYFKIGYERGIRWFLTWHSSSVNVLHDCFNATRIMLYPNCQISSPDIDIYIYKIGWYLTTNKCLGMHFTCICFTHPHWSSWKFLSSEHLRTLTIAGIPEKQWIIIRFIKACAHAYWNYINCQIPVKFRPTMENLMNTVKLINSLWPSDTIWRYKSRSIKAQVMACCLTAPSHYLNQCWLIISKAQWHPSESNFTRDASAISHWN